MSEDRAAKTRAHWLETIARYTRDPDGPGAADHWSPSLDCASRDELRAIQDAKLAALTPFLYENSAFYRRRFDRLGLVPTDLRTVDDLPKWPVVDKTEMMADLQAAPPFGTYTTHDDALWAAADVEDDPAEREIEALVAAGDESRDAPAHTAAEPTPIPSAADVCRSLPTRTRTEDRRAASTQPAGPADAAHDSPMPDCNARKRGRELH